MGIRLLSRRASWSVVPCLMAPLLGCGEIIDVPDDPKVVAAEVTGPWSCLGKEQEPVTPEATTATIKIQACDFISSGCSTPVTELTARVCDKKDVACTNPIEEGIMDDNGLLEISVGTGTTGFDGYIEVFGPMVQCQDPMCPPTCDLMAPDENCLVPEWAPALLFMNPAVVADFEQPVGLPLLPVMQLIGVVEAAGADIDPTAGHLFITAFDCDGAFASGVTFAISEHQQDVTQLYVKDGAVTNTVLETDASGIGGFVNVPPGFAEVEAFNAEQTRVGSVGVVSRTGFMTYSPLVPSP